MVHRGYLVDGTVVLDYGHEQLVLQGRVERWWYDLAAACGYIRLAVGLDPIPDDGGTDTATFMEASKLRGRLWTGITTLRIALPQGRR
ncbi:hypothetical protein ACFYU9_35395 [Streptomyces sp. NPDC004327]|uniref:hypothetical protein n=1 Tax=Streptomyces sp. NPDC004327 TaxID=3364699 RepID=UPI003692B861